MSIHTLHELDSLLAPARENGCPIVLAHGVFDLLSVSHIHHLQAAEAMGHLLIVTVTPDRWVRKGPSRPVFGEAARLEMIAALRCVDYCALNEWPTAVPTIHLLRPNVYVKGGEYRGRESVALIEEIAALKEVGGTMRFTGGVEQHTTDILERLDRMDFNQPAKQKRSLRETDILPHYPDIG